MGHRLSILLVEAADMRIKHRRAMITMKALALVILCFASIASVALADDLQTINGKKYKNATVTRIEPDGVVIKFSAGIVKIPFTDLSEELRRKYNYDPQAAKQFAADEQEERGASQTTLSDSDLVLQYDPPERLAAAVRKAAQEKMFSPEEEKAELAKVPSGGALEVTLSSMTIDKANPQLLTYVISNSAGQVLERKQGTWTAPSEVGLFPYVWVGFDYVPLPAFNGSLRVRVYHEILGNLGDHVFERN
jgi:hypothetical protein